MKARKKFSTGIMLIMLISIPFLFTNCSDDDELSAGVSVNETGSDLGGDVTGNGGSTSESFSWNNPQPTADYNMDFTAANGGSFNLSIVDADGNNVLNETLVVGQGDDSKSGVTSSGTSGEWTVKVTLTNLSGDGSFSLSPGD